VAVENGVWINFLSFTINEPIAGFQFRPISRKAFCVWSGRLLSFGSGDAHQTLFMILVPQVHIDKLRFNPIAAVKRFLQINGLDFLAQGRKPHAISPIPDKFIHVHSGPESIS
jgi:hypothetical protein